MRGLPFNYQRKGTVLVLESQAIANGAEEKAGVCWSSDVQKRKKGVILEPKSVLDQRSPSPPTSTSTLSSSIGGRAARFSDTTGVAAISEKPAFKWPNATGEEGGRKEEWTSELHPVPASLEMDWDTMFSESAASPGQEQTFLRWIMGDIDDPTKQQHPLLSSPTSMVEFDTGSHGVGFGFVDPGLGFEPIASGSAISIQASPLQLDAAPSDKNPIFTQTPSLPLSMPPGMFFQEPSEEKPQFLGSNLLLNQFHQTQDPVNPAFFFPLPSFSSSMENPLPTRAGAGSEQFLRPQPNQSLNYPHLHPVPYNLHHRPLKPKSMSAEGEAMAQQQQQQQHALVDQLMQVAELIDAGNLVSANGILARLNHQLPSAIGKPFLRSAFYFKEALQLLVNSSNPHVATSSPHHRRTPFTSPLATPLDVVLKLSAYKAFSEVSPILQFTNFTATQALLEELGTADCIHIIDFDIGVGGQWSSFMQELSQRRSSSSAISLLKITAFVYPYAFHPLELHLTKENLSHFATDLNIPFEISIASIECFDPAEILVLSAGSNETIAVNLPVGVWQGPSFSTLLRLVKQLLPKIVISMDQGCDRGDLLFSHYLLHSLQSCVFLLDSFDAAGTDQDVTNKIERFVLQPRIENCVIGRHYANEKMMPWRTLYASAGFVPFQFSNFTETQAECLLKRVQVRGFHVEKRQATLYLYWQRGELASVSAWRC